MNSPYVLMSNMQESITTTTRATHVTQNDSDEDVYTDQANSHIATRQIGRQGSRIPDASRKNSDDDVVKHVHKKSSIFLDIEDPESMGPLPLPYKKNCFSKTKYQLETFLVTHRRIHALYLLLTSSLFARGLVLIDMYTDYIIAIDLYTTGETFWFMVSSLFLFTPFLLVWVASLRFLQNWVANMDVENRFNKVSQFFINFFIFLYIFPPIGSVAMFIFEIFWILFDILTGFKAFIGGTAFVENNDPRLIALKV